MRNSRRMMLLAALISSISAPLAGCSDQEAAQQANAVQTADNADTAITDTGDDSGSQVAEPVTELTVQFGDEGDAFILHLYDNDTAAAIAGYVGTGDWRLPIYHYDDYENWEVMQYYDIPNRYDIPSDPETITIVRAGEVYYSDPNRIVLFYNDAELTGEYTPVGYFEATEEFVTAVEENPVLEGWGNKIVRISL